MIKKENVSDGELSRATIMFLARSNLDLVTAKSARVYLEEKFGLDLSERICVIKGSINDFIQDQANSLVRDRESVSPKEKKIKEEWANANGLIKVKDEPVVKVIEETKPIIPVAAAADIPQRQGVKAEKEEKEEKEEKGGGTFNSPMILSPSLSKFLQTDEMSRPQVVKRIWEYVKENDLQDPSDRRIIVCDAGKYVWSFEELYELLGGFPV